MREAARALSKIGLDGVEIAPTAMWSDLRDLSETEIKETRLMLADYGVRVSGIQSLFFGHPEYQLFDRTTWPQMQSHLEMIIQLTSRLGAKVAVFGSPKNRIKGALNESEANEIAAEFFSRVIPMLHQSDVVLTLEPNVPEYGADYLLDYSSVVALSELIMSPHIAPQIDTGCLWMYQDEPVIEFQKYTPHHIHLSTPNLKSVPGNHSFDEFLKILYQNEYQGWITIETIGRSLENATSSSTWLYNKLKELK
jgi:D-psicose/D-tagatose/L-ribulose 3-epimerase